HSQYIKYFDYFQCKCKKKNREFHPYRWQYNNRHDDNNCPFFKRYNYYKVLQTVDPEKKYQKEEKLGKKKKLEKIIKDVDILVSNRITQIEEYKLKSPKYQLQSPSIQSLPTE
ncbi:21642_t:CDS:2, partial [Dentiscutata erythropus]